MYFEVVRATNASRLDLFDSLSDTVVCFSTNNGGLALREFQSIVQSESLAGITKCKLRQNIETDLLGALLSLNKHQRSDVG